ncbi:hypothetical protein KPH14_006428 [Odynerus spinipes]|uniref:Uncharacterized protein n=1 Tax=Odynerus spinipes TaxID=1348599 RepID=A0AAD9RQG3_9HYME|nr:hypothetical protein KPH14_006428 [Odynerus spinipes]
MINVVAEIEPQGENKENEAAMNEPASNANEIAQNEEIEPEIEHEILEILGKDPSAEQAKEHPIHTQLAARWNKWITEGLPKEEKVDVLSKYFRKGSCKLEAPGFFKPEWPTCESDASSSAEWASKVSNTIFPSDKEYVVQQNVDIPQEESEPNEESEFIPALPSSSLEVQKIAGRLQKFITNWKTITKDKFILQAVKGYIIPLKSTVYQTVIPSETKRSGREKMEMKIAVEELILKGAIEPCKQVAGQFLFQSTFAI